MSAACESAILLLVLCGPAAAQIGEATRETVAGFPPAPAATDRSRELVLPANLDVPDVLRPLVTDMAWRSVTFRRQCARLAGRPRIRVRIELVVGVRDARARSLVTRDHGESHAVVQIEWRSPSLYVEYIAHELEHVLEQVDGIDLPRLARQRVDGVISDRGRYETARAQWVGRAVASEVMAR